LYLDSIRNRSNIFLIGNGGFTYNGKLNVHTIADEKDIPRIVIGDLREASK